MNSNSRAIMRERALPCCIVNKSKPLKSLLKPIFHLLKPTSSLANGIQCKWYDSFNFETRKLVDWIDQGGVWVSRTKWSTACNPRLPPVQCCQKSRYPPTQYNRISTLDILMPMTTCYLLSTSIISYHLVIIENCFIIKWKRKY